MNYHGVDASQFVALMDVIHYAIEKKNTWSANSQVHSPCNI